MSYMSHVPVFGDMLEVGYHQVVQEHSEHAVNGGQRSKVGGTRLEDKQCVLPILNMFDSLDERISSVLENQIGEMLNETWSECS